MTSLPKNAEGANGAPQSHYSSAQALEHIKALGYGAGDRVYFGALPPRNMPLDAQLERGLAFEKSSGEIISTPIAGYLTLCNDPALAYNPPFTRLYRVKDSAGRLVKDEKGNKLYEERGIKPKGIGYLQEQNSKGYGIYLIPNKGGRLDSDIQGSNNLFYEHDDISKEEQLKQLDAFGIEPRLVVETRKSNHCYFKSDYLSSDDWVRYQERLIQEMGSDPRIHTPAHLMRWAGFDHQKWDEEQSKLISTPVKIIQNNPDAYTSISEWDKKLPVWDESRWNNRQNSSVISFPDKLKDDSERDSGEGVYVPVSELLSEPNKKIYRNGLGDDRSNDLRTIAHELYGWKNFVESQGHSTDDPKGILTHLVQASGFDRADVTLGSINFDGCQPALMSAPSGHEKCVSKLRQVVKNLMPDGDGDLVDDGKSDILLGPEDKPGPIAYDYLYDGKDYARIQDDIYLFNGVYYEKQDPRREYKRITELFDRCIAEIETKKGNTELRRPYRDSSKVNSAYDWCLGKVRYIDFDEVNPKGLNLINGVLEFVMDEKGIPQPSLIPHSPDKVYTFEPSVLYDPNADDTHCKELLRVLDEPKMTSVLRVLSAAIDLDLVRKHKGRAVRNLILVGGGRNGKDAVQEGITYIYGRQAMTNVSIAEFHAYDEGKKFPLARFADSRVNWASENKMGVNIDGINSLKQANTGENLIKEEKHIQEQPFKPRAVLIFSTNDGIVNLTATDEAIKSRYAVVKFTKTFKENPKGPNELKANPKFKDDPQWVQENVSPALLNRMIEEFQNIFREGISYDVFESDMDANRIESNHLYRFASDFGLEEYPDGKVSTSDLNDRLRLWYTREGILNTDSGRDVWEEDVRIGDSWVKSRQQIKRRLQKIFPNIETYHTKSGNGIKGLRFVDPCESALLKCESWGEYTRILDYHGKEAVDKAWGLLPTEVQQRIASLKVEVSALNVTPECELVDESDFASEPTPEAAQQPTEQPVELLSEDVVDAEVSILQETVELDDIAGIEHLATYPERQKKQIWARAIEVIGEAKLTPLVDEYCQSKNQQMELMT